MPGQRDQVNQFRDAATVLYQQGRYKDAIELAMAAVQLGIREHGQGDPSVAADFGFLGLIYKAAGVYDRAEDSYRYAIDVLRSTKGNDAIELANHLNNLGVLYKLQGRFADAAPLYNDALRLRKAHFGERSLEVINSRSNIAALLEATGDEESALAEYAQTMKLARDLGEGGHPAVTTLLNNMGSLYGRRSQWNLAEPLLREAVDRCTSDNGATHPTTAVSRLNLGEALLRQGRPGEAGENFLQALKSFRVALGDEHERVALARHSLAEAIKSLAWKLDTEGSSLDPMSAEAARDQLTTFTKALEPANVAPTKDEADQPEKQTISVDISQVDEPLRPAVMQALNALIETGRDTAIQGLVKEHPELGSFVEPIVHQVRAVSDQAMGDGVPELVSAIGAATDPDERAALCRKGFALVNREDRPDIWFFLQWTLAGSLTASTRADKAQNIEDAISAMLAALSVNPTSVPAESWASALSSLGLTYRQRVRGEPAENIERAIQAYEAALAIPEHRAQTPLYTSTQNNLANAYAMRARGDRDENLSRAVFLFEQVLNATPRDAAPDEWARTQNNLGSACTKFQRRDVVSNRERAIEALKQALTIRTRERIPEKWAETMVNLGNAFRGRMAGDRRQNLAEARISYGNALSVWTQEPDFDKHLATLNTLAVTCLEDRDAAEFSLGPSFLDAELLIPLTDGELATIAGEYPELAGLVEARRAGTDHVAVNAPQDVQLARSIFTLCRIERAADRKRFLARHPELATERADAVIALSQTLLGTDGRGDWGEASLALLEESRLLARWRSVGLEDALRERIEFEDLEERASRLAAALWQLDAGNAEASRLIAESAQADDAAIGQLGSVGSELQRRRFLPRMRARMTAMLAAVLSRQTEAAELAVLGTNLVLRRKKVEGELWSRFRDIAERPARDPASRKYAELLLTRRQIAEKILAVAEDEASVAFQRHLLDLRIKEQQLEIALSELTASVDLGARLSLVDVQTVSAAMPKGSALVEFLRLPLIRDDGATVPASHYLAAIVVAGNPERPILIDLGAAEEIDGLVAETRTALTGEADRSVTRENTADEPILTRPFSDVARELRSKVFDPVEQVLAGANLVYLSPDGDLARLPFAILPTAGANYLIDDYEFRYLGAGRDLLRFQSRQQRRHTLPLVVADPDFELEGSRRPAGRAFFLEDLFGGIKGLASPKDRPLEKPDLRFDPLKWGRDEGQAVAKRLGVKSLVGKSALKRTIMDCRSPRILHLATHGFFLEDDQSGPRSRDDSAAHRLGMRIVPRHEDPLMRSWLLFAGANRWLHRKSVPEAAGNCVITAMEAATMSLGSTDLVVLSACDSGLGVIQVGEGVLGMRRGFGFAGARTVIMTLWQVPDRYTRDIIVGFYDRALAGSSGRAAALRAAQLALKEERPDPYFWGALVCEGDPGPLATPKTKRKTTAKRI